jgi:hypothetical protein
MCVTFKPFTLSVIVLNVVILSVKAPATLSPESYFSLGS